MTVLEGNDLRMKAIEVRLHGISEAASSARYAFMVCVVVAGTLGLIEWNAFLSNHRDLARPLPVVATPANVDDPVVRLRDSIRAMWVESTFVTVPLLNVRIGVNDVAVLGSFTLFVVSMWWYWCVRRENQAIGRLLRDTYNDEALRSFIFHAIADTAFVLTDEPVAGPFRSALDEREDTSAAQSIGRRRERLVFRLLLLFWPFRSNGEDRAHEVRLYGRFLKLATAMLVFLPSAAALGLLAGDVASLFTPSLFVVPGRTAFEALGTKAVISYAIANWLPAFVFVLLTTRNCSMIRYYRGSTETALIEYGRRARESDADARLRAVIDDAIRSNGLPMTVARVNDTLSRHGRP